MGERSEAAEDQAVRDGSAVYSVEAAIAATEEVPPGCVRTEVGVTPEDWQVQKIGALAQIKRGASPRPIADSKWFHTKSEIGWLRISDVAREGKFIRATDQSLSDAGVARSRLVRPGNVVMSMAATVGRPAINRKTVCIHDGFVVFENAAVSSEFLYYLLLAIEDGWAERGQTGSQVNLNTHIISSTPVVLPATEAEQSAIATALSDADALIESLDRLIAKKRDIKQAAMQQLLTGQTRLAGFTGEWSKFNFSEHAILKARIGWQGLRTDEYLRSGDYCLVTGTDFENGSINWNGCYFVDRWRYEQDKNIQLTEGDVLLTKDGTIGKVGFVDSLPSPATLNSGVYVVRPVGNAFEPKFIFYVFESTIFGEFLRKLQAGSTISHLYQKDFVGFSFSAPNIKEQAAIATVLSDMDAEIEVLERRRDKARQIKQGMMQQLLTGRVRLVETTDPSRECT